MERFRVVRRIGEGGMSVVYEAIDHERGARVALKTMRELTPVSMARLKHEFRVLSDVSHPNLVSLGQLVCADDRCFYTMELVDGEDFISYVRHPRSSVRPRVSGEESRSPVVDLARLREGLGQLAHALEALHAAGVVHRDVKPSNVRVTPEGRVVLLDFGLASDVEVEAANDRGSGRWRRWSRSERQGAGTPAYMAPEQSEAGPVGPEADWYAVGVLLYEALTGRIPFAGNAAELALKKKHLKPPPPASFVSRVTPDLDALCVALLRRDRRTRAGFKDVLAVLGGPIEAPPRPDPRSPASSLLGRDEELDRLRAAFQDSRFKGAVLVHVVGESGIGKTALVRAFTSEVTAKHSGAVVLEDRCYERETVPFKGMEGIVEALAGYLASLAPPEVAELLPTRPAPLVHLFPVFARVPALAGTPRVAAPVTDLRELRRRAFSALRELLARIGERRPLVLVIEDLKWADADSLALLQEVLRAPDSPNLLVVATTRVDRPDAAPRLDAVRDGDPPLDSRVIHLDRLAPADAHALAVHVLSRYVPERADDAERVAREGRGHPLWIESLVRAPAARHDGEVTLHRALWSQVLELEPAARSMVEHVAVAGGPLSSELLARAGGVPLEEARARAAALCEAKILAPSIARGGSVEIRHGRLRDAILEHLDAERRRALHGALASALTEEGAVDLHGLALHWREAGHPERAAAFALRAGDLAMKALAFDRAATMYGRALEGGGGLDRRALREKLAFALASSGRSARAAEAYRAAAHQASGVEAVELERRAADQLMRAGQYDQALASLQRVLAALGVWSGRSALLAHAWALVLRMWIALRGLGHRTRAASSLPPRTLARIDACSTAAWGLAATDHARGAALQANALALALAAGEPGRLARALVMEAIVVGSAGPGRAPEAEALLARAAEVAREAGTQEARALCVMGQGIVLTFAGRFADAVAPLDAAGEMLAAHCAGTAWEIETLRFFTMTCLAHLGDLRELSVRTPVYLHDARERGDVYAAVHMRVGAPNLRWLVADRPDVARREVHEAMAEWSDEGFHLEHWYAVSALANVDLYEGRAAEAHARVAAAWEPLHRRGIARVQIIRILAWQTRGRAALARAELAAPDARGALLAEAEEAAAAVLAEDAPWARSLGHLLRAGVRHLAPGRGEGPLAELAAAEEEARAAGMTLLELAAAKIAGDLVGRVSSASPTRRWDAWMRSQGVKNGTKLARMLTPGFASAITAPAAATSASPPGPPGASAARGASRRAR